MKRIALAVFALIAVVAVAVPNFADDKKPGHKPTDEEKKMMDDMMKMGAPCEFHKHMAPLAGKWSIAGKFHMDPSAPWEESKSTSEAEWILGGRFMTQKVKGEPMMGMNMPFEGFGLMGYDKELKKYVHTWADNMGTMLMNSEGTCDANGKTITFKSNYMCPMMHKETWMKSVYKIESNDKYVLTMFSPGPDGKEFTTMELVHTRAK